MGGGPRKWARLQSFKAGLPSDPLSPVRLCFLKAPEPSQAVPLAGDQAFKCEPVGGISYSKPQCPCVQTTKLCGLSSFVCNLYLLCSMCVALAVNSLSFSFLHHPKGPRGYRYGHSVITCTRTCGLRTLSENPRPLRTLYLVQPLAAAWDDSVNA